MIPEVHVIPNVDPDPCRTTGCAMKTEPVAICRDHRCPYRWTREARLDRAARDGPPAEVSGCQGQGADCPAQGAPTECARRRCPGDAERGMQIHNKRSVINVPSGTT